MPAVRIDPTTITIQSIERPPFGRPSRRAPYAGPIFSAAQLSDLEYVNTSRFLQGRCLRTALFSVAGGRWNAPALRLRLRQRITGEKILETPTPAMDMEIGGRRKSKSRALSEPEWIALLDALDPDRDRASEKYETARTGLIKIFRSRGLWKDAEDLADETLDRCARRLLEKASTDEPISNIASYMQAVASRIASEAYRRPPQLSLADAPEPSTHPYVDQTDDTASDERKLDYLRTLLNELPKRDRTTILEYYRYSKSEKIATRASLARIADKSKGALRVHAFRIRRSLREKLTNLLDESKSSATCQRKPIGGKA